MRSQFKYGYSSVVFFIGMAALFLTGWWWPGIIVLAALSALASAYERNAPLLTSKHIFLIGMALAFALGGNLFLPVFFVAIGLSQLPHFRRLRTRNRMEKAKRTQEGQHHSGDISIDELMDSSASAADGEYENLDELLDEEDAKRR